MNKIIYLSITLLLIGSFWAQAQVEEVPDIGLPEEMTWEDLENPVFGGITTIEATDKISDSRTTINDNFVFHTNSIHWIAGTDYLTPSSTSFGLFVVASSTFSDLTITGNSTTTNATTTGTTAAATFCISNSCISTWSGIDVGKQAWEWDSTNLGMTPTNTPAGIYLLGSATTTANLSATGYASTTSGLYTQGSGHYGGALTIDSTLSVVGAITGALTGNASTATNLADYSSAYTWTGINTFSSDLRATGGLHASTTDFDVLQVNGNSTTTGHATFCNSDCTAGVTIEAGSSTTTFRFFSP